MDDDAAIRDALAEYLRDCGYEVIALADGEVALSYLHASPPPAVILLDLSMPGMDGITFRRQQLSDPRLARVPVVVITAGGRIREAPKDVAVLKKPLNVDQLQALITRLLEEHGSSGR